MRVTAKDHVPSANCAFLLDIFFSSFVNALDFRDSKLIVFCFFKSEASNWNDSKGQNRTGEYSKCYSISFICSRHLMLGVCMHNAYTCTRRQLNTCISLWRTGFSPRGILVGWAGQSTGTDMQNAIPAIFLLTQNETISFLSILVTSELWQKKCCFQKGVNIWQ
jgi:hypothetical protein